MYIYMETASGAGGSDLDLPTRLFLHNSPQTFSGTLIHSECFTINVLQLFCQVSRFWDAQPQVEGLRAKVTYLKN